MKALALLFFIIIFALIEWQNRREAKRGSILKSFTKQRDKVVDMETEYDYNNSA